MILPSKLLHPFRFLMCVHYSLGSCSRFWRELCGSDCVWETLFKDRWPKLFADQNSQSESNDQKLGPNLKGWRGLYITKHNEMAGKVGSVMNFVDRALAYESIEVGNYLKAVELLNSHQFEFKDVQMFLLKPKFDVLLNLVALHYCINWLEIPVPCYPLFNQMTLLLLQIDEEKYYHVFMYI